MALSEMDNCRVAVSLSIANVVQAEPEPKINQTQNQSEKWPSSSRNARSKTKIAPEISGA